MNTSFCEIEFTTGSSLVSRALVAVRDEADVAQPLLLNYTGSHGLTIKTEPEFVSALSVKQASQFTLLHEHLLQKVSAEAPVQFLVLNQAPAQECVFTADGFDAALPVFIVFNVARNYLAYSELKSARHEIVALAAFDLDASAQLPATVGVTFPAWTDETRALCEKLDAPLILQDPPKALTYSSDRPMLLLMAQQEWSISHPLDCHWWRKAPVIDAEPADLSGIRMFRLLRPQIGEVVPGYIGRASFDFGLHAYEEMKHDDPSCPINRLISLASETAIANAFQTGDDCSSLPPTIRQQMGVPNLGCLKDIKGAIEKLHPVVTDAVKEFTLHNNHQVTYAVVESFVNSFGLAAERGPAVLEAAIARWQALCKFDSSSLPFKPPISQLAALFQAESTRPPSNFSL